jgi:beta-1,4-mannosyltransferase
MAHIVVIVLGDIGRSPRMQYHAQSLCGMDEVERVTVVGYGGETVLNSLQNNSKVHIRAIELNKLRYLEAKSSTLRAILKGTFFALLAAVYVIIWNTQISCCSYSKSTSITSILCCILCIIF